MAIEDVRDNVVQNLNYYIPHEFLNRLQLVGDRIFKNQYHAAWISNSLQDCIVVVLNDYQKENSLITVLHYELSVPKGV